MIKSVEQTGKYNLIGAMITSFYRIDNIAYAHLRLTDEEFAHTGVQLLGFTLYHVQITPKTSREELLSRVWGNDTDPGVLNVYVHYLREKLERGGEKIILSSRKCGYRISEKYAMRGESRYVKNN